MNTCHHVKYLDKSRDIQPLYWRLIRSNIRYASGIPCPIHHLHLQLARTLLQVDASHWGKHMYGAYNLVRFLHLHDPNNTILVVRVPLRSEDNMTAKHDYALSKRIASEVATVKYIETYTNIPVPHIFLHSAHVEGNAEGVLLSSLWNNMEDNKRRETGSRRRLVTTAYANAANYWLAYTNAYLQDICDADFGGDPGFKIYEYFQMWFMRSIIPALYDPSMDAHNIMITDIDTATPQISAVIDWEMSCAEFSSVYAYYPLFIVNHPFRNVDESLRKRNVQDQATFNELLAEAEHSRKPPDGVPGLSSIGSHGYPTYLFYQIVYDPDMSTALYPLIFAYIYSDDEEFSLDYYSAWERFEKESKIWLEACQVLGEGVVGSKIKTSEFKDLVVKHLDSFDEEGNVRAWLASLNI
ncbi:hypothetical protein CPB84DRAFT_1812458 [Gymnopilus junonius]|uniref:Aminoglycoside phosphotransferase domain-containing protein n=1 Tax=Gymnopilus junonius TaxID=109634 RepID=A0A9P5TS81_GYMJU|nr:hypothetical protein CPB84DRAFT_1812458 [Gymnopilus junonius]